MKKAIWLCLAIVLITFAFPACGETVPEKQESGEKKNLVVFVSGLGSSLSAENAKQNGGYGLDPAWKNVQDGLRERNEFKNSQFMQYSYRGFNKESVGEYPCQDTFNNELKYNVSLLNLQITQYLKQHLNTDVYIVSHSLGGVVTFGMMAQLVATTHKNVFTDLGKPIGILRGVAVLDSPLGGVIAERWYDIGQVGKGLTCNLDPGAITYKTIALLQDLFKNATSPTDQGQTASILKILDGRDIPNQKVAEDAANAGVKILVVGNENDLLWRPDICGFGWNFLSTQYLRELGDITNGNKGRLYSRSFKYPNRSVSHEDCLLLTHVVNLGFYHSDILTRSDVPTAIWQTFTDRPLNQLGLVPVQPVFVPTPVPTVAPVPTSPFYPGRVWYGWMDYSNPTENHSGWGVQIDLTTVSGNLFTGVLTSTTYGTKVVIQGKASTSLDSFMNADKIGFQNTQAKFEPIGYMSFTSVSFTQDSVDNEIQLNCHYYLLMDSEGEIHGTWYYPESHKADGYIHTASHWKGRI